MEDFWLLCRKESHLSPRQMSRLLNVSAHTYVAMEQGKIKFAPEIVKMLCLIYRIDSNSQADKENMLMKIKQQFGSLNDEERFFTAMENLTGNGSYSSDYRKIKRIKDNILK